MTARTPAAALLVLLLLGCSTPSSPGPAPPDASTGNSPSASSSESDGADGADGADDSATDGADDGAEPPRAPEAGTCHRLDYEDAVAPTASSTSEPCDGEHTARTFHVGTLDRVVGGRLLAVDSRALQRQAATECPRRLTDLVGGGQEQQRLSMLRAVWFTPTVRQSDDGADWLRCDVVALAGEERLLPLTGPVDGVLDRAAGRDRYGMCGTAEPGTDGFERVACAEPHTWRALRTVALPGPDYPGVATVQAAGEDPCTEAARQQAEDPLDFSWGYEWPTADQWQSGQTYGLCWAPTG